MDSKDIPYLLQRARFHRGKERTTECSEARCAHHQLAKNYQARLLAIRHARRGSTEIHRDLATA